MTGFVEINDCVVNIQTIERIEADGKAVVLHFISGHHMVVADGKSAAKLLNAFLDVKWGTLNV